MRFFYLPSQYCQFVRLDSIAKTLGLIVSDSQCTESIIFDSLTVSGLATDRENLFRVKLRERVINMIN